MNNNNADDVSGLNCVSLQNAFFQHTGKTFAIGSLWLFSSTSMRYLKKYANQYESRVTFAKTSQMDFR